MICLLIIISVMFGIVSLIGSGYIVAIIGDLKDLHTYNIKLSKDNRAMREMIHGILQSTHLVAFEEMGGCGRHTYKYFRVVDEKTFASLEGTKNSSEINSKTTKRINYLKED